MNEYKARCIDNSNYIGVFTMNMYYSIKDMMDDEMMVVDNFNNTIVVRDWTNVFKLVEMNGDVLRLEYQNLFDGNVAFRIIYRDDDVLPPEFEDGDLSVYHYRDRAITFYDTSDRGSYILTIGDDNYDGEYAPANIGITTIKEVLILKDMVARVNHKYNKQQEQRKVMNDRLNEFIKSI